MIKMIFPILLLFCFFTPEFVKGGEITIPDGALFLTETIFRRQPPESKPAFDHLVFWYQIATLHKDVAVNKKRSGIILKYVRTSCRDEKSGKVYENNFEGNSKLAVEVGGLFNRLPQWFYRRDDYIPIRNQMVSADGLLINASETPDKIVHWWTEPRIPYEPEYKCKMEMKVKIVGEVGLQIGADYWKGASSPYNGWNPNCADKNNCEAFVSEWYGDTGGNFTTIVKSL